jgi:hypothetical protein
LVHPLHKPARQEQTVVSSFYILNGEATADENDLSGSFGRRPNIADDPARYVAQVQISSVPESSVRTAVKDTPGLILDFFTDEGKQVRAVEHAGTIGAVPKPVF